MARAKAALKQLEQVDLAAGFRQHIEVFVVDVDVAVDVRRCNILWQHIVVDKVFRSLGTIFEHGPHRGVRVDVCILALDVHVARIPERQLLVDVHQVALGLADLCVLRAVQDVRLRGLRVVLRDQHFLHLVLYIFYRGDHVVCKSAGHPLGQLVERRARHLLLGDGHVCLKNRVADLLGVEFHHNAVPFFDLNCQSLHPLFCIPGKAFPGSAPKRRPQPAAAPAKAPFRAKLLEKALPNRLPPALRGFACFYKLLLPGLHFTTYWGQCQYIV